MSLRIKLIAVLVVAFATKGISQSTEKIFYSSFSPHDWDVYLSKDAGRSFEKLTSHPSLDYDAVISPDGKWVVFTSERSGIPQLYVKAIDSNDSPRLFIESDSFQDQAAFSPDGRHLAFVASHEGNAEIYMMTFLPDSLQHVSNARNLSRHPGGDFRPAFSPDGKKIAFSSDRGHPIVPHPQLPFARQRTGDIYTVDIYGEQLTRLTGAGFWEGSPVWSADGTKIIFYRDLKGRHSIFEMNHDGSEQKQIVDFNGHAVSPKLLPGNRLAFTTWNSQRDFKIMLLDQNTNDINLLSPEGVDLMFNLDGGPDGLMVFHGGKYPENHGMPGIFGFDGDVLVKQPESYDIGGKKVGFYGVRRAFVAPPQPGTTNLIYDAADLEGFTDFLQPLGYGVFWLPLLVAGLFLAGIFYGIKNRKIIPIWKYLLFSVSALILGIITGGIFLFIDTVRPMPVITIRVIMAILSLVLLFFGWIFYRRRKQEKLQRPAGSQVATLWSLLFFGLSIFSVFCAFFINQMVNSTIHFYQVDYETGEKRKLFSLEKERNTNPASFRVLDSKITSDGKSLIFTTGNFRGRAHTQGDIWRYDFEEREVDKISDSPYNDGFADLSDDGTMVFRSGRSGYFDIYLQTNRGVVNLTEDPYRDNFPAISRKGDKVVFASDRLRTGDEYKTMDIFLMQLKPDNSWTKPEKISAGEGQNAHPHFSPDGEWVIYTTEGYGINDEQALIQPAIFSPQMYGEIVAYNLKEKKHIRLTHNKWEDGTPLWIE